MTTFTLFQIIDLRQKLAAATADDPDNPPRKVSYL